MAKGTRATDKLLADFAEDERRHELATATIQNRLRLLTRFAEDLAPRSLLDPTAEEIGEWLDSRPLAAPSRADYASGLSAFYSWCQREGLRPDNPAVQQRPPRTGLKREDGRRTVADLVEPYIKHRVDLHEIGRVTARNQRFTLWAFADAMGRRPVHRLSRVDIERWLKGLNGRSAATRHSYYVTVKSFTRWLVRKGYVRRDPMLDIPAVRVPRSVPRAIPHDKISQLLGTVPDERAMAMCLLAVQEGLRCCEIAALEVGDIDPETRSVRVVGKGSHERVLPISDETWTAITSYLSVHPSGAGAPLIRSYERPWASLARTTVSQYIGRWMRDAGIKGRAFDGVGARALRHTAATDALRHGAHLRDVQAMLGHRHLQATEVYLPLVVNDLREAMGGRTYRSVPDHRAAD